jgi:hypothetical protein
MSLSEVENELLLDLTRCGVLIKELEELKGKFITLELDREFLLRALISREHFINSLKGVILEPEA